MDKYFKGTKLLVVVLIQFYCFYPELIDSAFPKDLDCNKVLKDGEFFENKKIVKSGYDLIVKRKENDTKSIDTYIPYDETPLVWEIPEKYKELDNNNFMVSVIRGKAELLDENSRKQNNEKCEKSRIDSTKKGYIYMNQGTVKLQFAIEINDNTNNTIIQISEVVLTDDPDYIPPSSSPTSAPTRSKLSPGDIAFLVIFLLMSICCCCVLPVAACVYIFAALANPGRVVPYNHDPYDEQIDYSSSNRNIPLTTAVVSASRVTAIPSTDVSNSQYLHRPVGASGPSPNFAPAQGQNIYMQSPNASYPLQSQVQIQPPVQRYPVSRSGYSTLDQNGDSGTGIELGKKMGENGII